VYGLYPTFTASQVAAKINQWALGGILTNIREYPEETFRPLQIAEIRFS